MLKDSQHIGHSNPSSLLIMEDVSSGCEMVAHMCQLDIWMQNSTYG
ncbi:hypothetical protein Hanom_Chr07g00650771 [Helianthus anomalus]